MKLRVSFFGMKPFPVIGNLVILALLCIGCKNEKKSRKEYYSGTKALKSEGYFVDNHPVDTVKRYSLEGRLESIDVFNASGVLNGECISYYKNGVPSEFVNYVNGSEYGRYRSYREDGTRKLVGFLFNGKPVGDAYFFDSLNTLRLYNFLDFDNKPLMVCRYDVAGKAYDVRNNFYLFDSLRTVKGLNETDTVKTILLISHQPKTVLQARIDNVGKDGRVIKSINISTESQWVRYDNVINSNVDTIKEIGIRYDSALRTSSTFIIVRLTKDLRSLVSR